MADYNLSGLSPRSFEQLIQAIAIKVIGPGILIFGDGPDGGREATFEGLIPYPSKESPWDGYGIVQAKFRQFPQGSEKDGKWAKQQLRQELETVANPAKSRRKPDYYILATNVVLSPVEKQGAKDKVLALFEEFKEQIPLKGYDIWDYDKIRVFLDNYEEIRRANAAWITSGDVLAQVIEVLKSNFNNSSWELKNLLDITPEVSNSTNIERFIQLVRTYQTKFHEKDQMEIQIMSNRILDLQRKQRLFGNSSERESQIWEIIYELNIYFFDRLGVSLLEQCYR
jgi:hypothetical protein